MMAYLTAAVKTIIIAYLARSLYLFGIKSGIGTEYNTVKPGPCRKIPNITCGSEQISVTEDGLAFITSGLREMTNCNKNFIQGHIYVFDFKTPDKNVTILKIISENLHPDFFVPHGMDILEKGDLIILYVVNHHHQDAIEVFHYHRENPHEIQHLKTIRDDKFICLNDVTVYDENHFYVTNFLTYCKSFSISVLEYFSEIATSNIVYYDNGETKIVVSGESCLNGLTLNSKKDEVVTVSTCKGNIYAYSRNNDNGSLTFKEKSYIGFHPDNIFNDKQTNTFYVGTHKKHLQLILFSINSTSECSSTAVKIEHDKNGFETEEILHTNGKDFVMTVASVVHYKGQYLFGTVFEGLGYCQDKMLNK